MFGDVTFAQLVTWVGLGIEASGILVTAAGVAVALSVYCTALLRHSDREAAFGAVRSTVGKGVLLGLELLVAGDIVRTVVISPSLTSVAVLAAIVAIRTFLSFTIAAEISGHQPWRRSRPRTTELEI